MMDTVLNIPIDDENLGIYFKSLINCFFKILPIRESEEPTLPVYMRSLQVEILGCKQLVCALEKDSSMITLVSILQYLIDTPECPVSEVKREVFRAISICTRLAEKYGKVV